MKSFQRRWEVMELTVIAVLALLLALLAYFNWAVAILAGIIVVAAYLVNYNTIHNRRRLAREQFSAMMKNVTQASNFALQNLPMGIALVNKQGTLVWNNSVFADWVEVDWNKLQKMSTLIPGFRIDKIWGKSGFITEQYEDKYFQIIYKFIDPRDAKADTDSNDELADHAVMALYFKDITTLEQARIKAEEAQPVWGMIQIDNIEELTKGLSDRDYTNLWADINNIVVAEIDGFDGFIRNFQDDMYTFAISRGALVKMESDGFKILEKIRKLPSPRQIPATISIGISENVGTAKEVSERARAALDIALGRGGDQVCIMDGESTRFFGGNTAGVEKNTRVRARVVGQAIHELMNDSEKILVMGHQREDYDALGGAIGIVAIARALGKEVRLALSDELSAIEKMVHVLDEDEFWEEHIITAEAARNWVEPNTLVIVCDTHRTEMVAVPEALDISERRIVIDHHRRAADFIENPLLTYLEPAASSTSELVTELVQYVGTFVKLSKAEATGIYAGIVLDTKNFYQQTGARTFEAAAFLRRAGADIEMVKQLFIETFDSIQLRAKIVLEASCTEGIAISVAPEGMMDMMALAAQSADMLISNEDIEAAFVLYSLNDGGIGVSARSKGKVNVQVVMEALGGGGHRTVAGAQLQGMTIEETKKTILDKALEALHSAEAEEEEE
ncbi:RNA-binding protein [Veillonella denticariosi JCM 15641]|uniref:Cyclic-di-AMP phosphodiesterase n=1 Tax=Veillonella denticariosi JCM 15641 TaxID=1298594 RepID=A0A2S7ZAG5_9FIRM|nr:DHH family phosphoesterase [Veillonella denticariosi]PQL20253.1 RNA-binding protein [Veillonella denticariosi JCM 15641]